MSLKDLMSSQGISWPRSPENDRGLWQTDRDDSIGVVASSLLAGSWMLCGNTISTP